MKLFVGIVAGVILLIMGGVAAQPGEGDTSVPEPREHQIDNSVELVTVIDDVEVPFDVLISIQKDHIGYAATQADEVRIEGQDGYRLIATRYDKPSDQDEDRGIRLLYDNNWGLIDEHKIIPPPEENDESDETEEEAEPDEERAENEESETENEPSDQEDSADESNGNIGGPREETNGGDEASSDTEDEDEAADTTEDDDGTIDDEETNTEDETTDDEEETDTEDDGSDDTSDDTGEQTDDTDTA